MKRRIMGAMALVFLLTLGVTGAAAAGRGCGRGNWRQAVSGQYFVDANGDGVCDNCGTNCAVGVCSGGRYFVDANGDGV